LRVKDLKEKNLEIQDLKKQLQETNEELAKIDAELKKIPKDEKNEKIEGTVSLWKHVDQLNKQVEEKVSL
jgi:septal ring factor EnvC (AmiA/AmiB activator)